MSARDVKVTNPAGRLYGILERARTHASPSGSAVEGWALALGLPNSRPDVLLRGLAEVADQAERVLAQVAVLPEEADTGTALAHMNEVEGVVGRLPMMGGNTMEWTLAGLTNAGMLSLRASAWLLDRYHREPVLEQDRVDEIRFRVNALIDDVRISDDFDEKTQRFILDLLLKIRYSLDRYRILGTGPVESATNEAVGVLRRHRETTEKIAQSRIAKGFLGVVVALDLMLNVAANAKALEPGEEPSPSPVVIEIVQRCGVPLELPPGVWQPGTETETETVSDAAELSDVAG